MRAFSAVRLVGRSDFVGRTAFGKMRSVSGAISGRGAYGEIAEICEKFLGEKFFS